MDKKKNFILSDNGESIEFTPPNGGSKQKRIPNRNANHINYIENRFTKIWEEAIKQRDKEPLIASFSTSNGIYLEIKGQKNYELVTKSLEDVRQNIRLYNVRKIDDIVHATVYIPFEKKDFYLKKINAYKEKNANKDLLDSIEEINIAFVEALWTGEKENIPKSTKQWCEVWLTYFKKETPQNIIESFFNICKKQKIDYKSYHILFPERIVVGVLANKEELADLMLYSGKIAELRKMSTPASFFAEDINYEEQEIWVNDLLKRTEFNNKSKTAICILDKGINNGHPLLNSVLKDDDMFTTFSDQIVADISNDGHGTSMAGIATYFNLEKLLESNNRLSIQHNLESVRILDDKIDNPAELYGYITSKAISLAEINKPHKKRVICMAITSNDSDIKKNGRPSSWSGAIDNLAVGKYESEKTNKRLIFISAGNTSISEIIENGDCETAIINHSIEDPGQAWNAITVGAFTEKIDINEDNLYVPLVDAGCYSPFTSTSFLWDRKWPIKPEIVLEGGNLGYCEEDRHLQYSEMDSLKLLTTNNDFLDRGNFTTISMTSSATAQASWIASQIYNTYPEIWPETTRALIIHSAYWPEAMKRKIFKNKDLNNLRRSDYMCLLRMVGYGVPRLENAIYSYQNSVNLIIENEIQPFHKKNDTVQINEMIVHEIPWPEEDLLNLGAVTVEMRVTLSYFVEPAPGETGWEDKYKYPSCRLYFDVNNSTEDKNNFIKRINKAAREDSKDKGEVANDSDRWLLGVKNRNTGSIHSDIWRGTASALAENRYVAVYPGSGWWKTRANLKKYESKIQYALIISISTPELSVDLYTAIQSKIKIPIKAEIKY